MKIKSIIFELLLARYRKFYGKHGFGRDMLRTYVSEDRSALNVHEDPGNFAVPQIPAEVKKCGTKLASGEELLGAYVTQDLSVLNVRKDPGNFAVPQIPAEVEF